MKKIILLGAIFSASLCSLIAEEAQSKAVVVAAKKQLELYPKNHKTFFLSLDNQVKLLKKLLNNKGKDEVIRYFLSLKNHDSKKALDLLSKNGNEDLRLVILENLPTEMFAELLNTLLEGIGGEAIAHWGYSSLEQLKEELFMIPSVRAQQYVNFFMQYQTWIAQEVKEVPGVKDDTSLVVEGILTLLYGENTKIINVDNEEILKSRGKKMAEVLNQMPEDKVIELLYGRLDTRFVIANARIVKGDVRADHHNKEYGITINNDNYVYQINERKTADRWEWKTQNEVEFKVKTSPSRVFSKSINYIIPHLNTKLIVSIFEKETKGDINALVTLIKSLGCEKAFNELFEYLEDSVKDKVYESCSDDAALFDMLGFDSESETEKEL